MSVKHSFILRGKRHTLGG